MALGISLLLLLFDVPALAVSSRDREALMDEIEQSLVLPRDARPLEAYGRNYAFEGPERVRATYLVPSRAPDVSEGCAIMTEDFGSRPCTREEIEEIAVLEASHAAAQTPAGDRRWHDDPRDIPFIEDGGCMQVNVEYDVANHRVLSVACNGR